MTRSKPANDNTPNPPFLTLAQVATRWQIHEKTVRRIVWSGELVHHKIGQQIRIAMPDLVTYERLHRQGEVA